MISQTRIFAILLVAIRRAESEGLSTRGLTSLLSRMFKDEEPNFNAHTFLADCGYKWDMVLDGKACPTCKRGGFIGNGRCIC